uniref:Uncharacterized protein n=1 Tax=Vibrio parahaemolyticus TaxID=670 RepID=A0A5P5X649_VIBPH|nr:hypothetical protein [Vibrio parahaemolyticus]
MPLLVFRVVFAVLINSVRKIELMYFNRYISSYYYCISNLVLSLLE